MAGVCGALDRLSPGTRRRFFDGFINVLRSSVGRSVYRQFLREYFEEENNLVFWEMCDDIIEHYEAKDMEARVAAARDVLAFAAHTDNAVNLDEWQLRRLRACLARPGRDDTALLEALHDARNTAFDWLEERYATFLECCTPGARW
ncbi:uncharacterized protein LOC134541221 [Bacillus rossius redtenbacheri]|uniref:uncharacterized protein LOC134541221 n=1 Tax=Bacillus rossius redtenbacheri TaxID=93214 RepID=UPI002FDF01D0